MVTSSINFNSLSYTIVCKGSVKIGMGHLFRAKTFAKHLIQQGYKIQVVAITDLSVRSALSEIELHTKFVESDEEAVELLAKENIDILFFDTIQLSEPCFDKLKIQARLTASLSPVFNCMNKVDCLFTRLENQENIYKDVPNVYSGIEYTIINDNCNLIPESQFELNIQKAQMPIGISMGGGDAPNKTKRILAAISKIEKPLLLWVFLGEGYNHSYNELVNIIKEDKKHEIILARTNRSLWYLLSNCSLVILAGGITYTEAIYAGLPTINLFESEDQERIIPKTFADKNIGFNIGVLNDSNLSKMSILIEQLIEDKTKILQMRERMHNILDKKASERIITRLKALDF